MDWILKHPRMTMEMLGYIPDFLSESNPRPAREQLNTAYSHGGGWQPFDGFRMEPDGGLAYPGDPPMRVLAEAFMRTELIRFYEHSWVAIIQPSGEWEVCRMD